MKLYKYLAAAILAELVSEWVVEVDRTTKTMERESKEKGPTKEKKEKKNQKWIRTRLKYHVIYWSRIWPNIEAPSYSDKHETIPTLLTSE